ncbi:hypothetical protein RvY_16640 [Ramazzottius varieornatus]|uniref:Methyltransferase type 11 domain-containing protein n=1 Tax=Ramazzottius varieornatus TaxID=947166 RepID=A0A1D1W5J2_RAMVA|nr:hypothetical protein RvY_16640 [Ramazzottius varieornatus]
MDEFTLADVDRIPGKDRLGEKLFRVFGGEFVERVKSSPKILRIEDFGVGYGFTTKQLLKAGAITTANDLSEDHLKVLWDTTSEEERSPLHLVPENVVNLEFPDGSFDGIMACRWFNFLTVDEVLKVLKKFHKWLVPGGRICVTMEFLCSAWYVNEYPKYLKRKRNREEWPGVFQTESGPQFEANITLPAKSIHYDEYMGITI